MYIYIYIYINITYPLPRAAPPGQVRARRGEAMSAWLNLSWGEAMSAIVEPKIVFYEGVMVPPSKLIIVVSSPKCLF